MSGLFKQLPKKIKLKITSEIIYQNLCKITEDKKTESH